MTNNHVFHGTSLYKAISNPVIHKRTRKNLTGKQKIIFNELSFHATSHKWIAIAYTYTPQTFKLNDREIYYNIGIDLYENKFEIDVYGYKSLEKSLDILYGNGGYVLKFNSDEFYHTNGLGNLECITKKTLKPLAIDHIRCPIQELLKRKVTFKFIDLALDKNKNLRSYKK